MLPVVSCSGGAVCLVVVVVVVLGSICLTASHLLLPRLDCPPSLVGITASLLVVFLTLLGVATYSASLPVCRPRPAPSPVACSCHDVRSVCVSYVTNRDSCKGFVCGHHLCMCPASLTASPAVSKRSFVIIKKELFDNTADR